MELLSKSDLACVSDLVYQHILPTPQFAWPLLANAVGREVWVKHENHTPTGAFKVRGGLVYLHELDAVGNAAELVTATRGNHGQSIPYAARQYNKQVHVFVPEGNSPEKNAAMQAWGAHLHVFGHDFDAARQEAERVAAETDAHLVPSFSEHLLRGVATYGAELFAAVDELDTIYVPIGMGSGACALIAVRDLFNHTTKIVGVVAQAADAMARSLAAGKIVTTETARTFADGMATRVPHPDAFAILNAGLERIVCVSDDEIAEAMRLLYRTTHNVAEGAGAAATAACVQDVAAGRVAKAARLAVILSGGNVDQSLYAEVLSGRTPAV